MKASYSYSGQVVGKTLLLIWIILCILFFISFPGKVTYVQSTTMSNWQLLGGKLQRLHPVSDLENLVRAFAGMMIFSLACTLLGSFVTMKLKVNKITHSPMSFAGLALLATEFLIGHGILSLIFLTLGGLYQLTPTYIILALVCASLLGIGQVNYGLLKTFRNLKSKPIESAEGKRDKIIIWLTILILILCLLYSTARISYDSSAVYFSDAKLTAMTQQIQFFMADNFVVSSFQSAIQYTALIQLFGDQSARMLSWIFGVVLIVFSLALGERVGLSKLAKLILLTLLLTSTAFLDMMGDGKVDLMSSAPAIAAVYWMVVETQGETPSISMLLVTGFLVGLAIVARPFNAFLLGIFVILFYVQRIYIKRRFEPLDYKSFASTMTWIGIGALGLGIYHLFANWMILGHPLSFLSIIPKINSSTGPWDHDPERILAIRLLYPFAATYVNSPQSLGNISPMFIAFLPALLIQSIRKGTTFSKQLYHLLTVSIATLVLWVFLFFTVYEIRYVLFLWAVLFIPLAEIIATTVRDEDRFFRNIAGASIITLLVFTSLRILYIALDTYSPIDELGNPQCFCLSLSPINEDAAPGDRVLTLTASRYYLRSDLFACSTKHDEYSKLKTAAIKDAESFWKEVYQQGYKYIVYENEYATRHLHLGIIPSQANAPDWIELEPVYGRPRDLNFAYRIHFKNSPGSAPLVCKLNRSGIWELHSGISITPRAEGISIL